MENEFTPLEQLRKANAELCRGEPPERRVAERPLHTIKNLVRAATAERRRIYEKDKNGKMVCVGSYNTGGRAIRSIIDRGF